MMILKKLLFAIQILFCSIAIFANDEDHHGYDDDSTKKTIEELTLSKKAEKNFGISVIEIPIAKANIELPISALVQSKEKTQIYIRHDGKYESKNVRILKRSKTHFTIEKIDFSESAEIVISGVNFLKVLEMSHNEEGSAGHGH